MEPRDLDLGTLSLFVGNALSDAVVRELHASGHAGVRHAHGYVVQHLIERERSIGELAERLGVTQQAASKSVAELEALGYVERAVDAGDARVRRVRLTARGRAMLEATRAIRARLLRRLEQQVGQRRFERARAALAEMLEHLGGADAVRIRRVRPPR